MNLKKKKDLAILTKSYVTLRQPVQGPHLEWFTARGNFARQGTLASLEAARLSQLGVGRVLLLALVSSYRNAQGSPHPLTPATKNYPAYHVNRAEVEQLLKSKTLELYASIFISKMEMIASIA